MGINRRDNPLCNVPSGNMMCKKFSFHVFVVLLLGFSGRGGHRVGRGCVLAQTMLVFLFFQIDGVPQVSWCDNRTCRG